MGLSYWESEYYQKRAEIVILGAGIVGISTAIHVKNAHPEKNVIVIDRSWPPYGASTKNAGFMCFGSAGEILDDLKKIGAELAIETFIKRWKGREELFKLVIPEEIQYEAIGGLELFDKGTVPDLQSIENLNKLIEAEIGFPNYFEFVENSVSSHFDSKAVLARAEGCVNPMRIVLKLKEKAESQGVIFITKEISEIEKENNKVKMKDGSFLYFTKLLITLNAFASDVVHDLKDVIPARNVVCVTSPLNNFHLEHVVHIDQGYMYMRMVGNRLLIGGARNKFGEGEFTSAMDVNEEIVSYLKSYAIEKLQISEPFDVDYSWAGILGIGSNKKPIIEKINDEIYVGVRLGGMGVAIGAMVGKELAQFIDK